MTFYLEEVPGARERPGGCLILVAADGGAVSITLPPRGVSPVIFFFACILLGNLLVALYAGLMLLLAGKCVLVMVQIAPSGLPVSLRHEAGFLLAALEVGTPNRIAGGTRRRARLCPAASAARS